MRGVSVTPTAGRGENLRAFSFPVWGESFFSLYSSELLKMSRGLLERPWKAMPSMGASLGLSLFQEHISLTIWARDICKNKDQ